MSNFLQIKEYANKKNLSLAAIYKRIDENNYKEEDIRRDKKIKIKEDAEFLGEEYDI